MKNLRKMGRVARWFLLAAAAWIGFWIAYGTLNDWRPKAGEITVLTNEGQGTSEPVGDSLTLTTWNIGYGGMGAEVDFFYDKGGVFISHGGTVIPPKAMVDKYTEGVKTFAATTKVDFMLFQEVDRRSKRSYFRDQFAEIASVLPQNSAHLALNYNVKQMPLPVFEPWHFYGTTYGGIATYSKYKPVEAVRHQLPGEFGFPNRAFQLDRCLLVERFKTTKGKDLVIINIHNSAHDRDGTLKKQEMDYLKNVCLEEFQKENYVIVGGDWNECPPFFKFDALAAKNTEGVMQLNISPDMMPDGWQYIYDPATPTNRKAKFVYKKGETFETVIDFYLISPNIRAEKVRVIAQDFQFSDHQPVYTSLFLN